MGKTEKPLRSLEQVSEAELRDAVKEMARKLNIPGSGNGYSLYEAVFREYHQLIDNIISQEKVPYPPPHHTEQA